MGVLGEIFSMADSLF